MVFNESKVFPCRLLGKKKSGGVCELFILDPIAVNGLVKAMIKTTRKKQIEEVYQFSDGITATLKKNLGDGTFLLKFDVEDLGPYLEKFGQVPIPPYIRKGVSDNQDRVDYQTVFAKDSGSVAAPTAGLHFTQEVFQNLQSKGVDKAYVTLHVGMGTFSPVKDEDIRNHKMHREKFFLRPDNLAKIRDAKSIIAVGTTSLRALEWLWGKKISPGKIYETDIFLYPGREISSVQGLLTNFHQPKSSLLMLVASLIGRKEVLRIYSEAIEKNYRFFSYGDAMLILP